MGIEGGRGSTNWGWELEQAREEREAARGYRVENAAEAENRSWIADIIDPAKLERLRQHPALAEHSDEWIIMEALLGKLVEGGAEMDPLQKARLGNLVGVLRALFYPNMNQREQEFMHDLVTKSTVDFSKLEFQVTSETREDVRYIWRTFGLEVPPTRSGLTSLDTQAA